MATFIAARAYAHKRAMEREAAVIHAAETAVRAEAARLGANHLVVGAFYAIEAAKAADAVRELEVAA